MALKTEMKHQRKLEDVIQQMEAMAEQGMPGHIDKGGVSHFVPLPGDTRRQGKSLDIAKLNEFLQIDPVERIAVAEPGMSFAEVLKRTLPLGLMPAVVPELKGITLGGAIAGASIESSSFRYATFHDSCLEYEVLTADGVVLTCSREKDPLLFEMMHSSYGTLGILTRLTFRLIPAGPYVHVSYLHCRNFLDFKDAMLQHCRSGSCDFIDGIIHGPQNCVLCLGHFVNHAPFVSTYDGTQIYYKSTQWLMDDYLSTYDYCFRYDTECHWLSRSVPLLENSLFRRVAGRLFLGSTNLIKWSRRIESLLKLKKRPDVVCDVFIPSRNLGAFWEWYERVFDYYPLWIVPARLLHPYPWLSEAKRTELNDEFVIDCAVYGKANSLPNVDFSQLLEAKTEELGGIKTLISRNHYSPEQFWRIFDKPNYDLIKQRVDPQGLFPDLYT
ncbi:MAG: FAD-binding oxidoreductase, partial [Candidatus Sericytochromatia bacterium]